MLLWVAGHLLSEHCNSLHEKHIHEMQMTAGWMRYSLLSYLQQIAASISSFSMFIIAEQIAFQAASKKLV